MGENFIVANERRAFTRLAIRAPVNVRQGDSVWDLELIDLSLTGLAVIEPEEFLADYAHPFSFKLALAPNDPIELQGSLVHMEPGCIGFDIGQLDKAQLTPLSQLLAERIGADLIEEELKLLED
jgi:hypothetical protein